MMRTTEAKVTTSDVRDAGFCVDGLREWCDANGVDLRTLVKGRYTIQELIDLGAWDDANGRRVLEYAKKRQGVE
jgi:hypothetical protein